MITREEIRHLAKIDSPTGCAISFYFQPQTPQDKSHREEAILMKDLVREAARSFTPFRMTHEGPRMTHRGAPEFGFEFGFEFRVRVRP